MLGITLSEYFGDTYALWNAGVLATDISEKMLDIGRKGFYPEEKLEELPKHLKIKYFKKSGDRFEVSNRLKSEVTFRRLNLMNAKFPFKSPFDVIFCRNLMIYFDDGARRELVDRFYDCTVPGGFLFIAHSESLGRHSPYEYIRPAIYRKAS